MGDGYSTKANDNVSSLFIHSLRIERISLLSQVFREETPLSPQTAPKSLRKCFLVTNLTEYFVMGFQIKTAYSVRLLLRLLPLNKKSRPGTQEDQGKIILSSLRWRTPNAHSTSVRQNRSKAREEKKWVHRTESGNRPKWDPKKRRKKAAASCRIRMNRPRS